MATGGENVSLPRGYDYEFVSPVEKRFICIICELPFRDSVQTKCGHKFCRGCLVESMRRFNNVCPIDRTLLDLDRDVFSDVSTQREIMDLHVRCNGPQCDWVGELREAETHVEKCTNTNCTERLPRSDMKKHVENECEWRVVSCDYCSILIPKQEEGNHHEECGRFPLRCVNGCEQDPIPRSEMQDHVDNVCQLTILPCPYQNVGCNEKVQRTCLDQHVESSVAHHLRLACDKLMTLEEALREESKRREKIEAQQLLQREKQDRLSTMYTKLVWPIRDFNALLLDESDIHSPPFYSCDHGYKLKLRVFPNGYGRGKSSHLSVIVVVTKGEYDTVLPWPLKEKVEITLLSQKQGKKDHWVRTLDFSKVSSDSNKQPRSEETNGWGCHLFISHKALRNSPYLVDDTIFLQAKVIE